MTCSTIPFIFPGSYNYLMSPSPSPWAIHSPMLSPHSIPPTFHSISNPQVHALPGSTHYSPESQFRHPLPPTPQGEGFFQWPQQQRTSEVLHSPYLPPPPLVSTYPHTPTPLQHTIIETSPSGDTTTLTLPDFGSTFASVPTATTRS